MKLNCYLRVSLILCLACLTTGTYAQQENPIPNPSFEQAENESPAPWRPRTWNGAGDFKLSSQAHTGNSSLQISSQDGGDLSWSANVPVQPFSTYKFSGWIKTENLKLTTGQGVLFNVHNISEARTQPITGTQDWTLSEMTIETNENDSLLLNCLFGGWGQATGTAWFDDLKLERISTMTFEPSITIDASQKGEPISKYIYGQFIEHLGRCIYGGIWAEMLEDRKFYYPVTDEYNPWGNNPRNQWDRGIHPVLRNSPWKVVGAPKTVQMMKKDPYVGEQTPEVKLSGDGKSCGIEQHDLGLLQGKEYAGYVIISGDAASAPIQVSLVWGEGADDQQTHTIKKIDNNYIKYPFQFKSKESTNDGVLRITGSGKGSFKIGTISLMPADNVKGFRADTLQLLKELDSPVYRWPGGNFVSGYDWKDGVGPRDKRPPRKNPAWTGVEHNDVGIHEFMDFCALLDTEPYIAVNTGAGKVDDAALEVQYCNGAITSPMGRLRADNGHPESFRVKYWAVGNEMYGDWQIGHMPLTEYVKKHNQCVEKMRAEDPSIHAVGVGAVGQWSETMMTECADYMESLSEHFYCQERPGLLSHVMQIPNQVERIARAHREYRKNLSSLDGKDIRIAMDEWNYWYGPHVFGELGTRYFLKDGLGIAAGINAYARNSDIYFMANYAQTVNVIGCIKTTRTHAEFETTGLILKLYRKEFGVIPVTIEGESRPLDVAAALTSDGRTLTLSAVNPTNKTMILDFNIKGIEISKNGKVWRMAGEDEMAYNKPGEEPKVRIVEDTVEGITDSLELEPVSVSFFSFSIK